ncbi:MAG: hypothetical protein ACXWJR_10650, partial [Xanthobacteraceae bacterium]
MRRSRPHRKPASEARREPHFGASSGAKAERAGSSASPAKPKPTARTPRKPALRGTLRRRALRFAVQWS